MEHFDALKAKGTVHIELFDELGRLTKVVEVPNMVVTAGKNVIAERLADASPTHAVMSYMALGTSSTAPSLTDTILGAEIAGSRTALVSTTVSGSQVTYTCTFGAGVGTGAVQEAGIFNASSGGDMLAHTTFSVINKGASDTLTITWSVTIT